MIEILKNGFVQNVILIMKKNKQIYDLYSNIINNLVYMLDCKINK
jgi:hypothetical protein